jgi:hypothetical protein
MHPHKIEELKKRIRNIIEYWNEDESLFYNECIEALINLFKEYAKSYARSLVPEKMRLENEKKICCTCGIPYDFSYCGCIDRVVFWNACCEEMLRRIEKE